jgi:pimeloyl-ACP methyl ester carboxylesterase
MHEGAVDTRDGRKVAYAEFGDPDGTPVVVCHGSAECRLVEVDPGWTATRGVRVITSDRPGFGGSDPQPDRTLLGWASDAEDLIDALGIDEFAMIGWSGGGPHALAAAHALGSRVRAISLVGSFAPFKLVPGAYEVMAPQLQLLADLAPADPRGTAALVAEFAKPWVDDPDTFGLGNELPPEDQAVESHPEWGPNLRAQIREGLRRADGIAWDAAVLYGDWGFPVETIRQPADVWHGTVDAVTPFLNGEWLARTLPNATLHPVVGGHFIFYSHWQDIISTVVTRLPQ